MFEKSPAGRNGNGLHLSGAERICCWLQLGCGGGGGRQAGQLLRRRDAPYGVGGVAAGEAPMTRATGQFPLFNCRLCVAAVCLWVRLDS